MPFNTRAESGGLATLPILDGGVEAGDATSIDFTGSGVSTVVAGGVATVTIDSGITGIDISDDGAAEGEATEINFAGAGVSVSYAGGVATVTVSGSTATLDTDNNLLYAYNPLNSAYDSGADPAGLVDATDALQAAMTAACSTKRARLIIDGRFRISQEVFNNAAGTTHMQTPYITGVNTTTDVITFNKAHGLNSGDPFELQGHMATGLTTDTLMYGYAASSTTIIPYTTQIDALTNTGSNRVNITGATTTTISGVPPDTTHFTVASTLNAEIGTGVLVAGGSTSGGSAFIIDITGSTITVNRAITGMANGAAVTFVGELDWKYWDAGLEVIGTPGSGLYKDPTYSLNAILGFYDIPKVTVKNLAFAGYTYSLSAAIDDGDDGLRFMSCKQVEVDGCKFMFFGDSAIRITSSTRKFLATTENEPYQGISTKYIRVTNNYFDAIEQISTTTDDYFHGGASEYWLEGNTFARIRGSIKFANRVPGGRSLWIKNNKFLSSTDKFLEIDSYENVWIRGNEFWDCETNAIYLLSNNGPDGALGVGIVGFQYNNLDISKNYFNNTGFGADAYSCLRLNPDIYEDATRFDYNNVTIDDNIIENVSNTSHIAFNILNGCYRNLSFRRNVFQDYDGVGFFRLAGRGSTTSGFKNNIRVEGNNFNMNHASGIAIYIVRASGTEKLNGISIKNNFFTGTGLRLMQLGDVKNITFADNWADITGATFLEWISGAAENFWVHDNKLTTSSTFGFNFVSADNLYVYDNYLNLTAGSSGISINNSCKNVWCVNNRVINGLLTFRQVPVHTKDIGKTGRREDGTAVPSSGTWQRGSILDLTNVTAAGSPHFKYCVTGGTFGTLSGVTVTTDGTTNNVTFAGTLANMCQGCWVILNGDGVIREVTTFNSTTGAAVVSGAVPASMTAQAVAFSPPVFEDSANLV